MKYIKLCPNCLTIRNFTLTICPKCNCYLKTITVDRLKDELIYWTNRKYKNIKKR